MSPINTPEKLVKALQGVFGKGSVHLHEPIFDTLDEEYVLDCIRTGWVSSIGKYVDQLERDLEKYSGAARAVVVMNGTAALHMAYMLADMGPNVEVLCPSLTFVATGNAILYTGATPHFVEVESDSLGVDPHALEAYLHENVKLEGSKCINKNTNRVIHSLVVTHIFGNPAKISQLQEVCHNFNLILIEDAAESLGSFYKGQHTGTFGKCGIISFNGNKVITTGGGGALLTNDIELGKRAKYLTTTAKQAHPWAFRHSELGYNYRMPNINAALGCSQLAKITSLIHNKKELHQKYCPIIEDIPFIDMVTPAPDAQSNYWLNAIIMGENAPFSSESLLQYAHEHQVFMRPIWDPLHTLSHFAHCPKMDLKKTESLAKRIINLPSSAGIVK